MTVSIRYECPKCQETLAIDFQDFAPGQSKVCSACQTPSRITQSGLEHFSQDVRRYCFG